MATPTDPHAVTESREPPSQAVFIGWLALALFVFALAWAGTALLAAATHGFQ
jgi:hypothetical protein